MSLAYEYDMKSPIDSPRGNISIWEENIQKVKSYTFWITLGLVQEETMLWLSMTRKKERKKLEHYMLTTLKGLILHLKLKPQGGKYASQNFVIWGHLRWNLCKTSHIDLIYASFTINMNDCSWLLWINM